jgi:hypothetical protein
LATWKTRTASATGFIHTCFLFAGRGKQDDACYLWYGCVLAKIARLRDSRIGEVLHSYHSDRCQIVTVSPDPRSGKLRI